MSYDDDSGVIYDDQGRPIGSRPKVIKLPDGTTWSRYESKKAAQARLAQQGPSDQPPGYDIMQNVQDMFGFKSMSRPDIKPGPAAKRANGKRSRHRQTDPFSVESWFS